MLRPACQGSTGSKAFHAPWEPPCHCGDPPGVERSHENYAKKFHEIVLQSLIGACAVVKGCVEPGPDFREILKKSLNMGKECPSVKSRRIGYGCRVKGNHLPRKADYCRFVTPYDLGPGFDDRSRAVVGRHLRMRTAAPVFAFAVSGDFRLGFPLLLAFLILVCHRLKPGVCLVMGRAPATQCC